jgi:hypothetical protein
MTVLRQQWEFYRGPGAAGGVILQAQGAAMFFDQVAGNGEPQARALAGWFSRKEGLKKSREKLSGYSRSVILNVDLAPVVLAGLSMDADRSSGWNSSNGVADQGRKNNLEMVRVGQYLLGAETVKVDLERGSLQVELGLQQRDDSRDQLADRGRLLFYG